MKQTNLKAKTSPTSGADVLRVALYSRVSSEEQAQEGFSLEGQEERLRSLASMKGWTIQGEYTDPGFTGRDTKRPAYTRMMEDIDKWDVLAVWKMDRIHRNARNFMVMFDKISRRGKEFYSINETLDTTTAMGRFVMDIIQRMAQLESETIGERTSFGLQVKSRQGEAWHYDSKAEKHVSSQALGQQAPYGYAWSVGDPKHGTGEWIIMPAEAAEVRQIFELAGAGEGRMRIAEILGWCTCKSTTVKYKHVQKDGTISRYSYEHKRGNCSGCLRAYYILGNPAYVGYFNYRGQIQKGTQESIVSRDLFEKAQRNRRTLKPTILPE